MQERIEGIAIVGGGIAGRTLAAALRRTPWPRELVEAGNGHREGRPDRGVCLWTGALAALDRINLARDVADEGVPIERLRLWSGHGHLLVDLAMREGPRPIAGMAIRGTRLMRVLQEAGDDTTTVTGHRLLGMGQDQGPGVVLELAAKGEIHAEVAIGADGPSSRTRLQLLDDGPPSYSGDTVWEGVAPAGPDMEPGTLNLYWAAFGLRAGAMRVDRQGAVAWWVDLATGAGGANDSGPHKPELRSWLAELHGPLPALVESTPEAAIRRTDVLARRQPAPPLQGRATLVGDAWHPFPITMRLGGSLAIEDAVALSEAIRGEPNLIEALRGYERARLPRVHQVGRTLWRLHLLETRYTAIASWARNTSLERLPGPMLRDALGRLLAGS